MDTAASWRCRPVGADDGSLPMAMLLTFVAVALSTLLVPVGVAQVVATRTTSDRARALHAAQAGLDVMLGRIRSSVDNSGNGVTTSLPTAAITGSAGPGGTERYRASVTYYASDGSVFTVAGATTAPSTAALVSTGVDAASVDPQAGAPGSRTLQATYTFRTSNENIPGGKIPVNGSSTTPGALCLGAPSAKPAVGSPVTVQLCSGDPNALRFVYTPDLTLRLYGSELVTARGLCLQGAGDPTSVAHSAGQQIVLAACAATTTPHSKTLIAQQWSLQSYGVFWGTTNGVAIDSYCLTVSNPGIAGSTLSLSTKAAGSCASTNGYNDKWTLLPEPTVGAGYAGASQNWLGNGTATTARQLVSVGHEQFGRCLDIAGTDSMNSFRYMIAWPCKQSPDPTKTAWGQMWILPAIDPTTHTGTGVIKSVADSTSTFSGTSFCLQSYGSSLVDPWVKVCPTTATTDLLWTLTADTSTYSTSYVIKDNASPGSHLCLTPAGPNPTPSELYVKTGYTGPPISRVVLRTCDGTQWQKWNAPASLTHPSPITDLAEN